MSSMFSMFRTRSSKREGFGTIEAVILIAVLIGLAIVFRKYIMEFLDMIFESIFEDAKEILDTAIAKDIAR